SYYWAGKVPAAQFFTTVPFGMNAQQMNAWILCGGGMELWKKTYAKFNIVPMIAGNTGVQMGGWYNKEINTMSDLTGLKMRIPGLGGKVLNKAGGTAVLSPGSELYTNLERGIIDATEWIGPYHDYKMGFYQIAKYYYTPGWHETGSVLELIVNKKKLESLPKDLQVILETACMHANQWILSEFEAKNATYLRKLIEEENVQVKNLPEEVLAELKELTLSVLEEESLGDPLFKEVYDSFRIFKEDISQWSSQSEKVFYNSII
ncbi:MAG: TRAP transporter substrate-binding protein, partial [Bacteroidia bacterium]|nr:TRAP transporter substrate-binding protein [Bacteroidia bacterium]